MISLKLTFEIVRVDYLTFANSFSDYIRIEHEHEWINCIEIGIQRADIR